MSGVLDAWRLGGVTALPYGEISTAATPALCVQDASKFHSSKTLLFDFAQNSAEAGRAFCSDLRRFPRSTRPVSCWLAMRNACYSVPISGRADKCFDDLHGGQGHFHRDPRQETYNPNAERFSQHAKLCSDVSGLCTAGLILDILLHSSLQNLDGAVCTRWCRVLLLLFRGLDTCTA